MFFFNLEAMKTGDKMPKNSSKWEQKLPSIICVFFFNYNKTILISFLGEDWEEGGKGEVCVLWCKVGEGGFLS